MCEGIRQHIDSSTLYIPVDWHGFEATNVINPTIRSASWAETVRLRQLEVIIAQGSEQSAITVPEMLGHFRLTDWSGAVLEHESIDCSFLLDPSSTAETRPHNPWE